MHVLLDFAGRDEQPAALVQQRASGGREPRPMAAAVEQQHVELVFQPAYGVRDRRRHAVEFQRGGGETAASFDGVEHGQGVERKCHVQIF